jgi:D-alanine-D-alanine ligase
MNDARARRGTVLYNAPILSSGHPDAIAEADVVIVARAVAKALQEHGLCAELLAVGPPIENVLAQLLQARPDAVFNLVEGYEGSGAGATYVTGLLELAGLAYTGCPPEALGCCLSKSRAKALLMGLGLPTAPFRVLEPSDAVPDWPGPWPVIVKPDGEDASLGIDQSSVAVERAAMREQIARTRARYGGRVLVEAYLPGAEYNVGVLALPEPEALEVAAVAYVPVAGAWPILTYESKWLIGSPADLSSPIVCPARIASGLDRRLRRLAVEAFRATDCRDYARVDFRLDGQGEPMILEVNPNPDIGPEAGLARAIRASGLDYGSTIAALAHQAILRGPRMPAKGQG